MCLILEEITSHKKSSKRQLLDNLPDLVQRPLEDATGMTFVVNNRRQFLYIQNYHE